MCATEQAASKEELLEMIRFGADTVIRMGDIEDAEFDIEQVSTGLALIHSACDVTTSAHFCKSATEKHALTRTVTN